ncbi:HK97 family phage prohead protease [Roseovarius sp. S1116L3]|uniref:HK97 family phage prohead protease n=1 Tax=Roseovarius roseus TaxID=3342636 RepID=UPI00372C0245
MDIDTGLERKFAQFDADLTVKDGVGIEGYASYFGDVDQGGDVVVQGAYAKSLARLGVERRQVKMLWQHDSAQPIGIWDEVREDKRGLYVKGRLLEAVGRGREAAALIGAGAIDGLSIGYRTVRASKNEKGQRLLQELELWEVSLVTFPMLPSARIGAKGDALSGDLCELAAVFEDARRELARL